MRKIIFIGLFLVLFLSFISAVDCGTGKKFVYQKMGSCGSAKTETSIGMCVDENATGCVFAIPGNNPSCWNSGQIANYDNAMFYYGEGKLMGWDTGNLYGRAEWYDCICKNNIWIEASDNNQQLCEAQIGVSKTLTFLNPLPKQKWMGNSCCGDDCFEFYKVGGDGTSTCCDSFDKIVVGGKCYNNIHDVEINVTIPSNATAGDDLKVETRIKNKGSHDEEVDVEFEVKNETNSTIHQETKTISLEMKETKEISFVWKAIEGIYNFFVRAKISNDENLIDNEVIKKVTVATLPYQCADSDGGLNYTKEGKASLQISSTRIRSFIDGCKVSSTNFLGNFDNNIGPGGGAVIKDKLTGYLYEAICKDNKPAMVVHECNCFNGECIQ